MERDYCLIHYTDRRNLERIKETGTLRSALCLMREAKDMSYEKQKRKQSVQVGNAVLRDQQPLNSRIVFCDGATLPEFIEYLNGHVFFWPSSGEGKQYRMNFRKKYKHPKHIGLRCRLSDLCSANGKKDILFSPYNSGSAPQVSLEKSPRHLNLFQSLKSRKSKSCKNKTLVEIVIKGEIRLPHNTEYEKKVEKWVPLFE